MKYNSKVIKEIKKIIEEQFYSTGFDVAMGEYSSQTGLSCIKENLLEKLDQLEQEQKDVEVISNKGINNKKDLKMYHRISNDFLCIDTKLNACDIDHIEIVKKKAKWNSY